MRPFPVACAALLAIVPYAFADCQSSGVDFVDGGGPYCIDTTSPDYFSFGTGFNGCVPNDTQGGVVPIVVAPNTDDFYCSTIATNPDGADMISTCNLPGDGILKSSMVSGTWTIVIEGLTFAWMRSFEIIAGSPVVTTQTPTATFSITQTPSTIVTTTFTSVYTTTFAASTTTVPFTTSTVTTTITPSRVTSTSTILHTVTKKSTTKTILTKTITQSCETQHRRQDPTCTIHPQKASLAAAASASTNTQARRGRTPTRWNREQFGHKAAMRLAVRSPDLCTTTVMATSMVSEYTTITLPTSTQVVTTDTTITSATTLPPVTAFSGTAEKTMTITAPTPTRIITIRSLSIVTTTKTIVATITSTLKTAPSGAVCAPR